jgi:stearoyl-CoA desaturase (Delta-9 desaturase)
VLGLPIVAPDFGDPVSCGGAADNDRGAGERKWVSLMSESVLDVSITSLDEDQGATPATIDNPSSPSSAVTTGRVVTAFLVCAPLTMLTVLLLVGWGHVVDAKVLILALALYFFTGFGVSVGLHRLFTHRSFKANRVLKVVLAIAGSMALEGSLISWVAIHRRHHMFSDQPGDPHSPNGHGSGFPRIVRGFVWAHVGWLFAKDSTDTRRFAPDLYRDRDLVVVDRLFPLWAISSLAIPFFIGWALWGTIAGAVSALLWAGFVRMALLHHVTWSINSICHLWGRKPFVTNDASSNVACLALVSMGESWHNFHHTAPASARHGVLRHQIDLAAGVIRFFEMAGWATKVRWPTTTQITAAATNSCVVARQISMRQSRIAAAALPD